MISTKKIVFSAATSAIALSGCSYNQMVKAAADQNITATPSPLELHGDSVKFEISAALPLKMMKKNKLYTLKTNYKYDDQKQELEDITFNSADFPNQDVEKPTINQNFSFFYEDDMKSGTVNIMGIVSNTEKTKFKETVELDLAQGVITTSRLVRDVTYISFADHGYNNKEELIPTYVDFFFDKGSAKLKRSEVSGKHGSKLDAFIASKFNTKTVTITGSHSPEGLESINSELAEERAKVIEDFYFDKMKQYDYKNKADSIKFDKKVIFQDWAPFVEVLDSSQNLSSDQKNQIKQIIAGSTKSFEETEKDLQKKSSYRDLEKFIHPQLRFSKTEIWSVKAKKSDAEISILAKGIVDRAISNDTLSAEELLYAATLTPLIDEKEGIYRAAVKYNSSWIANNNLGAIYLQKAQKELNKKEKKKLLQSALTQFELSLKKEQTAEALNNKAVVLLAANQNDKAITTFNAAASAKASDKNVIQGINAGLGSIYIKKGDYTASTATLVDASDIEGAFYNLGLSYLLSKDFKPAEEAFENALYLNEKDALANYCLAIIGARTNDKSLIENHLGEAIKLDADLREKALGDLEFIAVKSSSEFTEAVK
jgi:tetratricopeptide (TPR) repeat protein